MLLSLLIPLGALAQEAYAVLTADGTLTFYYDNQWSEKEGILYDLNTESSRPYWYYNRNSITQVVFDASFRDARPSTTSSWFYGCSKLTSLDLSNLNTSNVTSMNSMFYGCSGLTALDVSNFDTSSVTSMGYMFYGCSGLTALDVSNFDTSNVTSMRSMFGGCSGLTALDVSSFNTSRVSEMTAMFSSCSSLTTLDLSNFNTSWVREMSSMFYSCSSLTTLDLSSFNTSYVMYMGVMFSGCSGLTTLDLSNFNTSNVQNMSGMFMGCSGLTTLDVSSFNTSNVTSMGSMFDNCSGLTTLDVSSFNTSKVTDMWGMFRKCSGLTALDVSYFDTSNVTSMGSMFEDCSQLTVIYGSNGWNTDKVTDSGNMFSGCTSIVGGAGTTYSDAFNDKTYAHIDGGADNPGYMTEQGTVFWDENSMEWPDISGGSVDIIVKRTINADEWSTISLPFDMTEEQVKKVFGNDVLLKEYVGYNVYLDNDKNVTGINLNFVDADLTDGFHLNHPYLIKVSKNIKSFLVTSTINVSRWDDVYIQQYDEVRDIYMYSAFWTNPISRVLDSGELFLSGNKFWYSTGLTRTKGLRANFRLSDLLMSANDASARISMSFDDSESTTGIGSLTPTLSEDDGAYYDLSGRRVEKPVKGLYIRNNKKVFVK